MKNSLQAELERFALVGLEAEKRRIEELIVSLRSNGQPAVAHPSSEPEKKARRKMSASARKRIGEASRKRWEALRAERAKGTRSK